MVFAVPEAFGKLPVLVLWFCEELIFRTLSAGFVNTQLKPVLSRSSFLLLQPWAVV